MIRIDRALLDEVGIGALRIDIANVALATIYGVLERRVGEKLAARMSNRQLDEFEVIIDQQDETAALRFLEREMPDYKEVVRVTLDELKVEIAAEASGIVADVDELLEEFGAAPPT